MESPQPTKSESHLCNPELINHLIDILGSRFQFKEPTETEPEFVEEIVLDPTELDRHTAIEKAVREGKPIARSIAKNKENSNEPPLVPSRSEKLSTDDYNTLMMRTFPEYEKMKPGDVSEENAFFVAWDLVQRYPTSYIGKTNRPKVSTL